MLKNMDKLYDSPSKVVTLDLSWKIISYWYSITTFLFSRATAVRHPSFSPKIFSETGVCSKDQKKYRILEKDLTSNKANQRVEGISFFPIFRAPLSFSIKILQKQHQYSKNGNILKSGKSVHFAKVRQKCFKVQKTKTLKSFFCHSTEKSGSKKYGTFENWWYFKKWQKLPFCTGYREAK